MRDHIAKPVDLEQLVACLRRHVGQAGAAADPVATAPAAPQLLDRAAALQRLGGRQPLYDRLIQSFVQDVPDEMDALRQYVRQASVPDTVRVLHTLRGLAGAVGANALAADAGAQEQAVRARADVQAADADALQRRLDETLALLTPPPAPAVAAEPVDPLEALRRLRQLLVERNMRSVAACEQLAGQADALGPEFVELSTAIGRLDFAKALKACDGLLENLNPR
jgi:HPt (histidine-containing phosphotransfer) domain-containing protein